jgi:hypothetical protein
MIDTTYLLISVLTISTVAAIGLGLKGRDRTQQGAIALISAAMLLFLHAQPAQAAMATNEDATSPGQAEFEDKSLNLNPGGRHYSGLEYVKETDSGQMAYSDTQIEREIKSIDDRLTAGVVNGSVIVSGRVANKETAQDVVNKVKAIPGVHEVTFDLGLSEGKYDE